MTNNELPLSPEEQILQVAEKTYSPDLPYHNFEHAIAVTAEAMRIVNRCEAEGVAIDREVVRLATLFHDAGYHRDHKKEGFDSKEALSADIARTELAKLGIPEDTIARVVETILATRQNATFTTNEQMAVRAADLSGLAKDYNIFLRNTILLKQEHNLLYQDNISWEKWKEGTEQIINFYLSQDIYLTSEHDDSQGESHFHQASEKILQKFLATTEAELTRAEALLRAE